MVKKGNGSEGGSDRGRVRIVFVDLEGNNESLQEGLRTLTATINRQQAPPLKQLSNPPTQQVENMQHVQSSLFADDSNVPPVVEPLEQNAPAGMGDGGNARKRGEGKRQDRNAGLTHVADLNLRPAGKTSLKEFTKEKNPETDEERVLVFVYYLKETLAIERVGPNHVFHCFKDTGTRVPADLKQTIRNIEKKAWLSFSDIEDLRVAVPGQNIVEHDLPRVPAAQAK